VTPALTPRGKALLLAAAVLLGAARLLGTVELAGLAVAALVALALAVAQVRGGSATLQSRVLEPARAPVGSPARARLRLANLGARPTRLLTAVDGLDGGRGAARVLVPPLAPGETAEAEYLLPTKRRGIHVIGPLTLSVADPFGLAEARTVVAGEERFVVHPRMEPVLPLPGWSPLEARVGSLHASPVPVGLDFFAVRPYVMGDDIRRVHWRSTARTGALMLRQDEVPWESSATVLLDTRAFAHRGASFERAVEVAGSLAAALARSGRRMRFLTTGGFELGLGGRAPWSVLVEYLAVVSPDRSDRFAEVVEGLRKRPGGPLAAVVVEPRPAELAALGALRSRLGLVMVAALRPSSYRGHKDPPSPTVPGAVIVPVTRSTPFATAWNQAVLSCRRPEAARR
jgi:uncharacterized protein (DUF58 family)